MKKLDIIIKESINKYILKETANNEDAPLYHFTRLRNLSSILTTQCIKDRTDWGAISLTRNKNGGDGFPSDKDIDVRICFSPSSLLHLRGAKIKPFSFFNTGDESAKAQKINATKTGMDAVESSVPTTLEGFDEFETTLNGVEKLPLELCDSIDILLNKSTKQFIKNNLMSNYRFKKYVDKMLFYVGRENFNFKDDGRKFDDKKIQFILNT